MLDTYRYAASLAYLGAKPVMELLSRLGENRQLWQGRMGMIPPSIQEQAPWDLWLQAVSVGEVGVAAAIINALDALAPGLKIIVSSSTVTGFERAGELLGHRCGVIACPVDFPQAVSRAADLVSPSVFTCIETELWPSMLVAMYRRGSVLALLNGRISSRSLPRYRKIRLLTTALLQKFSLICASSAENVERLRELGASPEQIILTGNAKYEALLTRPDPAEVKAMAMLAGIDPGTEVLVAGSIRSGDEFHLIEAWDILRHKHPDLLLIIAPRHMRNVPVLMKLFEKRAMSYTLWSRIKPEVKEAGIIIVDRIGLLFNLYGLASVAFVGGSMTSKGGQNILEPAAWQCPVLYGPYTDNFEDAVRALEEQGAGGVVMNGKILASKVHKFLVDRSMAEKAGKAAGRALEKIAGGAATRQAEVMVRLIKAAGQREHGGKISPAVLLNKPLT